MRLVADDRQHTAAQLNGDLVFVGEVELLELVDELVDGSTAALNSTGLSMLLT